MEGREVNQLVYESGEAGPKVFFCHGLGGRFDIWKEQTETLKQLKISFVLWEWWGHGNSPRTFKKEDYSFANHVEDGFTVIKKNLGVKNILVIHSLGLPIAMGIWELLTEAEKQSFTLVLCAVAYRKVPGRIFSLPSGISQRVMSESLVKVIHAPNCFLPDAKKELIEEEAKNFCKNHMYCLKHSYQSMKFPDENVLRAVNKKVYVILGTHDKFIPPEISLKLLSDLKYPVVKVLEAGHLMMIEKKEEFNEFLIGVVNDQK